MKKLIIVLALTACFTAAAVASPIYGAGSNGDLYSINPTTWATTEIGVMGTTMYDIAEYGGVVYGISSASNLYIINTTTGHATEIGSTGFALNALTFDSTGTLFAAGTTEDRLYTINLTTGAATAVPGETNTTAYNSTGDLQFIGNTLYLTTGGQGANSASSLDTVNLTTGVLTDVGAIKVGSTAVDSVYGLVLSGSTLYGFTGASGTDEVISIDTTTAAATDVSSYGGGTFKFYGTTSEADAPSPEPGTLVGMALGLVVLGVVAYRRRGLHRASKF